MNLKKRLSSLLLALVVAATMMGGMTGSAFADAEADAPSTDNVEVVLNGGTDHARVIGHLSKEWFRKNTESKVQVFPFASKKKAGKIAYVVGKGVPMEKFFDDPDSITEAEIIAAIRKGTIAMECTPMICGSSYKNKGVQPLLDYVCAFLPSPMDTEAIVGTNPDTEEEEDRKPSEDEPTSALAFKIATDPYMGRLVFFRVYSGKITAGSYVFNSR